MEGKTTSERLGSIIGGGGERRMSIRAFATAMRARDPRPPGSTRAMVHRYLAPDGPEPPAEFVRAAAEVLGVRPEWLAFGKGAKTEVEEEAREGRARVQTREEEDAVHSMDVIVEVLRFEPLVFSTEGTTATGDLVASVGRAVLADVVTDRGTTLPDPPLSLWEARLLVRSLRSLRDATWRVFRYATLAEGVEEGASQEGASEYASYALAIYQAIRLALPAPGEVPPRQLAARLVRAGLGYVDPEEAVTPSSIPSDVPEEERESLLDWLNMEAPQAGPTPDSPAEGDTTSTTEE